MAKNRWLKLDLKNEDHFGISKKQYLDLLASYCLVNGYDAGDSKIREALTSEIYTLAAMALNDGADHCEIAVDADNKHLIMRLEDK